MVIPQIDDHRDFPGGGNPCLEMNNFCVPPRPEWKTNFGLYKKCSIRKVRLDLRRIFGGEFLRHHPQQGVRDSFRLAQQAVVANFRTGFRCDDGRQRGRACGVHQKGGKDAVRFNFWKCCFEFRWEQRNFCNATGDTTGICTSTVKCMIETETASLCKTPDDRHHRSLRLA